MVCRNSKGHYSTDSLLLTIARSSRLAEIRWSVCISKPQRKLCVSFSRTDSELRIYHLFIWSNFNFLHNSQWITLLTQSCLVLYSFCVNLLHSFLMWLIVSSLSPHSLHLLFSSFCLLFYAAIRRLPFLNHVQVFLCEILIIFLLKYPYSCFSSHFCFLVVFVLLMLVLFVLFLVAIISLFLRFLI